MPIVVERILDLCKLGEAPHWDVDTQSLYFVDIIEKSINKYTPSTKTHSKAIVEGDSVAFVIPVERSADKYLISVERAVCLITWDGVAHQITDIQKVAEVDTESEALNNRINDAKCDALGRLWFGTMARDSKKDYFHSDIASFYGLELDGKVKRHLSSVFASNGLAWNSNNKKFYYIDTGTREIHQYDFDLTNGTIGNKTVVFSFEEVGIEGYPDGQTIDADGNLWIAVFNGYKVINIDPRRYNTLLGTIDMPIKQVTSVAFGGPNLDELYVTSAGFDVDGNAALYKVTGLEVKGCPGVRAKIV